MASNVKSGHEFGPPGSSAPVDGEELGDHPGSRPQRTSGLPLRLRQVLPGLVVLIVILRAIEPVKDPDTFWHLAAGDYVRETWTFDGPDPFSAMSTQPWQLHEWLPELLMSLAQHWGLPGVAWLLPVGVGALSLTLWVVLRERAGLLVSALVLSVALVAMSGSLSLRPHLVTFALTALTTGAWLRSRDDGRARWWLIPLTWLWACSHGMWFVGVAIGVAALVGFFVDGVVRGRRWLRLALVPLGSLAAAALTPVGPSLLGAPFAVREMAQFVTEWRPPSLSDIAYVAFLALAATILMIWARTRDRAAWVEILLVGLAIGLGLLYDRTIAVGAAIIAPLAAIAVSRAVGFAREPVQRREIALTCGLAVVGLLVAGLVVPSRAAEPAWGPNDLDSSIAALPQGTVVCNDYGSGGWIIWKHRNVRPVIDGRAEVYSVAYVSAHMSFEGAVPGWEAYLKETGCRWALVSKDLPVSEALVAQAHWTVSARGSTYVLLKAPA